MEAENSNSFQPFTFESNCHQRHEFNHPAKGLQQCIRTISVRKNTDGCPGYILEPGVGYIVSICEAQGNRIMSDKPMKLIEKTESIAELRGFPIVAKAPWGWQEVDYRDYGLTVYYSNGDVSKCIFHMFDRNVDLEYKKELAATKQHESNLSEGSRTIIWLATQLNLAHRLADHKLAGQLNGRLYEEVSPRKQGGRSLINLPCESCQCVGVAFATMALHYRTGDIDNSKVAAENAYYCLAKSLIKKNNLFVAPSIYAIMQERDGLMDDMLIRSWQDILQERGMTLEFMDCSINEFRRQAISFKDNIAYYVLSYFYDIDNLRYKVPIDIWHIPNEAEIHSFIARIKANRFFQDANFLKNARKHFISVYEQCENELMRY